MYTKNNDETSIRLNSNKHNYYEELVDDSDENDVSNYLKNKNQ